MPAPYKLNAPHFHPWLMADGDRILYKCKARHTRQATQQWAARREPNPERRMVLACYDPRCQPPLD